MPTCRPAELEAFATEATNAASLTETDVSALATALDGFRASEGWDEFLADVAPLDIDAGAVNGMLASLASWVAVVAARYRELDATPMDGVFEIDEHVELGIPRSPIGEGATLVKDGDRWILSGTDLSDHVRLERQADGGYIAFVGQYDPASDRIIYQEVGITAAQAGALTVRVGEGNDVVEVPQDQNLRITTWTGNGNDRVGDSGENPLVSVGGGGDERIFLGDGDDVGYGGAGNDQMYGGDGDDVVDGQDGDDHLSGGGGVDSIYGGRGNDGVLGGQGDDILDGGSDDDHLEGSSGNDAMNGGRGQDTLLGQAGNDTVMGGRDADVADGGFGDDRIVKEQSEVSHDGEDVVNIELTGEPGSYAIEIVQPRDWMSDAEFAAWQERIDSDLEFLRGTETGRVGLQALDDASHDSGAGWNPFDRDKKVVIVPYGNDDGTFTFDPDGPSNPLPTREYQTSDWLQGGTQPQPSYSSPPGLDLADDVLVNYASDTPGIYDGNQPSATVLYHELSHSYDQISGGTPTGTFEEHLLNDDGSPVLEQDVDAAGNPVVDSNGNPVMVPVVREYNRAELNSVGFDLDGDGTIDTYESDGGRAHPTELTENAILGELGYDLRPSYGSPPGPGENIEQRSYEN